MEFFHGKVVTIRGVLDQQVTVEADDLPPHVSLEAILGTVSEILADDLCKVISAAPSKCCMLDPVPTCLLKEPVVLQPLLPARLRVVNTSFTIGVEPPCRQHAVITPIIRKHGLNNNMLKITDQCQICLS